jgi:hypothetical protein
MMFNLLVLIYGEQGSTLVQRVMHRSTTAHSHQAPARPPDRGAAGVATNSGPGMPTGLRRQPTAKRRLGAPLAPAPWPATLGAT